MKSAPIPSNEMERLQSLLTYQILDTSPEIQYDDLTLLASEICNVPIALVSLIDSERQWFKSKQGLNAPQTPRGISFCGHAILQNDVFVIPDSSKDERFVDNPLAVEAPHVRFYAGAPLVNSEGYSMGTLCVIDSQPRELNPSQLKSLKALARQVVSQMELRKSNLTLQSKLAELQNLSIQLANNQELLVHASKMTALGEMASGIAHEINNPLTIIEAKARKILRLIRDNQFSSIQGNESLEKILTTSGRIAKIIRGLRTFSRNAENDPFALAEIKTLIEDILPLCLERFKLNGIKLVVGPIPELSFECRITQIEQVLLNLLNNAHDAVEDLEDKWIQVDFLVTQDSLQVSVIDSGLGILSEIAQKLMQPFFTTKEIGKGTGLGLSISKGIIEGHHGRLWYDSSRKNTCFVIALPIRQSK